MAEGKRIKGEGVIIGIKLDKLINVRFMRGC